MKFPLVIRYRRAEAKNTFSTKPSAREAVQCDLSNVVTARWLAKGRGWI
ncbi:MAG: hypothetical protein HY674_12860 [Chloroflexi bacterium]|nr:hypothetical protein [Chloroflexota bacterium]